MEAAMQHYDRQSLTDLASSRTQNGTVSKYCDDQGGCAGACKGASQVAKDPFIQPHPILRDVTLRS